MDRKFLILVILITSILSVQGQGLDTNGYFADEKYHQGSNEYIGGDLEQALNTVNTGLEKVPNHPKLLELKKLLEQEKEEQEQQEQEQKDQEEQQQEQEKKEQEQQEQEQEQQEQQGDQEKKEQEQDQKEQESEEQDPQEEKEKEMAEKLEEMNMSEEKARMILEAMKNSERQYLQQLKRKATKKNTGKPDW